LRYKVIYTKGNGTQRERIWGTGVEADSFIRRNCHKWRSHKMFVYLVHPHVIADKLPYLLESMN
jgi:hypothetical protein